MLVAVPLLHMTPANQQPPAATCLPGISELERALCLNSVWHGCPRRELCMGRVRLPEVKPFFDVDNSEMPRLKLWLKLACPGGPIENH